ncbi:MAG: hypothetical protein P4L84_25100 [Isosphaeraceae bacterium]|nr:hypothetical protein [Isosphaeraceae bacterium]
MIHTDGVGRARAVALAGGKADSHVIPGLIGQLEDPDPVVQLTANEELKRVTGQDFGFAAWLDPAERKAAVDRWSGWWKQREADREKTR